MSSGIRRIWIHGGTTSENSHSSYKLLSSVMSDDLFTGVKLSSLDMWALKTLSFLPNLFCNNDGCITMTVRQSEPWYCIGRFISWVCFQISKFLFLTQRFIWINRGFILSPKLLLFAYFSCKLVNNWFGYLDRKSFVDSRVVFLSHCTGFPHGNAVLVIQLTIFLSKSSIGV